MDLDQHWKKIDQENERFFEKQMEDAKKSSAADRDFFAACQQARRSLKEDDPIRNEDGEFEYTPQQGYKAACHGREDVAAVLVIQRALLIRLDRNHKLLWGAIALLAYIAYRIS